jgi:16S rRNA (adenine1518-N6/adenine1519-N6)-dimethyltransferase
MTQTDKNRVVAKKRFGQNFLKDVSVIHKIIETIPNLSQNSGEKLTIVEIGAGLGDLTKHLLNINSVQKVVVFEIDTDLCKILQSDFYDEIKSNKLVLNCGDVLEFWKTQEKNLINQKYHLVANLPYYISTTIILNSFEDKNCLSSTVMVQKEVGDKFLASPEQKEFSALGVISSTESDRHEVVKVPPEAFEPPPKVDSVVIQLIKHNIFDSSFKTSEFRNFLKIAFSQPRKTLKKNLISFKKSGFDLSEIFSELELIETIRPHQVGIFQYHQLYEILTKGRINGQGRKKGND